MVSKATLFVLLSLTAVASFFLGAFYEHDFILRNLHRLLRDDPYAFFLRTKLYALLDLFNFDERKLKNFSTGERPVLEDIMKYDFPGLDDVRVYSDFVLSYDRRNRVAHWVYEHLRAPCVSTISTVNRSHARYQEDTNIPLIFRSSLEDYQGSGYDRGHLASAANHKCHQTHCNETFYLSNIAPQVGKGFNQNAWYKLEAYVRSLTLRYGSVYVCTGPLYMPERAQDGSLSVSYHLIGYNAVAVPTHFFKVIIVESQLPLAKPYMEAYIMPNTVIPDDVNLRSFLTEISVIERSSGLHFFNGLRREYFFATNLSTNMEIYTNFK